MRKSSTVDLIFTSMFMGIMLLMYAFPFLGFIPLGPINATTLHIPVIIASILLGPKYGAFLGGFFGILSMLNSTFKITVTSFIFSPFVSGDIRSLVIALVPRILIGIVPYYVYQLASRIEKNPQKRSFSLMAAGFCGSLVNTVFVLNFIYLFYMKEYAQAIGKASQGLYLFLMGLVVTTGIPEAIVASIFTAAITSVLLKIKGKTKK